MSTPDPVADLIGLARQVGHVRTLQKRYFAGRGGPDRHRLLQEARDAESRLDERVREILGRVAQPGLFGEGG